MSGGPKRRFPRMTGAALEPAPKIEREKIRHRRPNDMVFEGADPPPTRRSLLTDDDHPYADGVVDAHGSSDQAYDPHRAYAEETAEHGDEVDWTRDRDDGLDAVSGWDDEAEDDWVLKGDDARSGKAEALYQDDELVIEEPGPAEPRGFDGDYEDETSYQDDGVVWEDDSADRGYVDRDYVDDSDEIAFDREEQSFGFAPEVELAGRRDVRPKPLRPAPSSRAAGPRRTTPPADEIMDRSDGGGWADLDHELDRPDVAELGGRRGGAEPRRRGAEPLDDIAPIAAPAAAGRFARTRSTMGSPSDRGLSIDDDQVLHQPRPGAAKRRRQAHGAAPAATAMPKRARYGAARTRGRKGRGLILAVLVLLLAGGGWYGYRSVGAEGLQPVIDRLTALVPLTNGSRTAADTSFGSGSPEEALADLEEQARQQDAGAAVDPATVSTSGPPIPAFKPTPGASDSLSSEGAAEGGDEAQFAANEGDGGEPSIFQQLWQLLTPG